MTDAKDLLKQKLADAKAGGDTSDVDADAQEQEDTSPIEKVKTYMKYISSRVGMRMITEKGKQIDFANNTFITDDEECIEYLNKEIDNGLNIVTKGGEVSSDALNPMAVIKAKLRREILADLRKEQEAEEAHIRNLGETDAYNPALANQFLSSDKAAKA